MALLIKVEKGITSIEVVEPKGETFTLQELQNFVCGNIELLFAACGEICMVVNEDGKTLRLPVNMTATMLYSALATRHFHDTIVGNVLLCKSNEID